MGDCAGGKGELGFQIINLTNVECTVLDPRPMQLRCYRRRYKNGMYHRNLILGAHVTRKFDPHQEPLTPMHLPVCLDARLVSLCTADGDDSFAEAKAALELAFKSCAALRWTCTSSHENEQEGLRAGDACDCGEGSDEDEVEDRRTNPESTIDPRFEVETADEAVELLRGFSICVGMHPDQATEPLVDLALALNRPFACVPCCVFAKSFPMRQLKDGSPVVTYEQFIQYLCEKAPPGCVLWKELDFGGKNVVVYSNPDVRK